MSGDRRVLSQRQIATSLAGLKEPYHFVAIDCETTGKRATDRIVALALLSWSAGKVWSGWSSLIDPGLARIGATHIHSLEAGDLDGAPNFATAWRDASRLLVPPPGKTTVLIGHNVAFDIARLRYELDLLDQQIPEDLHALDTGTLARATGLGVKGRRLEHLLGALGLANPAPHQATGDALAAGQTCAALLERLAEAGRDTLADLVIPASAARPGGRAAAADEDEDPLDPEHAAIHGQDLVTNRASRETNLRYCLDHGCVRFPERVENAITDQRRARELETWCLDLLADTELSAQHAGLAAGGLGRALRRLKLTTAQAEARYNDARYNDARPILDTRPVCSDPVDRCDRCAQDKTCRFLRVRQRYVNAFLYTEKDTISLGRAEAFLPVPPPGTPARRGPKRRGWYGRLRSSGDLDAAAHGAVLVARRRRDGLRVTWALATLELAWKDGLRSPSLAYTYSTMLEQNYGRDVPRHLVELFDICDAVVSAGPGSDRYGWRRLVARHTRLKQRIAASAAPPRTTGKVSPACHANQPLGPRNQRSARPNPYAVVRE